jgi:hypothetical protein
MSSFEAVSKTIARAPVLAGMDRMQPAERALATRLLARFVEGDARPLPVAEEGAALALWGVDTWEPFLAWHRETSLSRAIEVTLAAVAYHRVTYEWDSSVWALRRTRPSVGLANLGPGPWLWLREQVAKASTSERAAAAAGLPALRTWTIRAALAIVFPEDPARWTAADEAELRQAEVTERAHDWLGVLVAMRHEPLDVAKIRKQWRIADAIEPAQIVRALGPRAVAPLRLIGAFEELAALDDPEAIRALAELADQAFEPLARLPPSRATIAALAPMFTRLRPRRVLGMPLARALFDGLVVAAPDEAAAVIAEQGPDAAFLAQVLADTGATLPPDPAWTSPWGGTARRSSGKPAAKPRAPAPAIPFTERIHWQPGEREEQAAYGADLRERDAAARERKCLKDAQTGQVLMLDLHWLPDEAALRTWRAIEPKRWYGQVDDVQCLLARFGLDHLDLVLAFLRARPESLAALARVESPRVAPLMARGFALLKKHQATGQAWLERFPEAAAIGLVGDTPTDKKQREANAKALAHLARQHAAIVERVLGQAGGARTTSELATADAPALPARPPRLPGFVDLARLPRPIRRDGTAALAGAALGELVQLVTLPAGHPMIEAIAERFTPASLARFAFGLFRQWLFAGAPPKHKWALHVVGTFPDDDHARALGRLARVWAPQGNSARAQEAVETLAMMRTHVALAEIHDIARKVQSRALAARAEKVFEAVAEDLGISADELADRLVPELSDADLSFGDLRVELDANLEPRLVTADGSPVEPAFDKASEDAARWKALHKLCRDVARGQLARLELAMAEAHRMSYEHFAEVYQMHSVIRHLARSLVWGAYDRGELARAFRLDVSGPVDLAGAPLELPPGARYGVVHPIELAEQERAAWARWLPRQPFPQLAREVFAIADPTDLAKQLARHAGRTVATAQLLALLRRGWKRGDVVQGGTYYTMHRTGDGWAAEIVFEPGIYLGNPGEEATQLLEAVAFRADRAPPLAIVSDVQRDLAGLTGAS